MGRPSRNATLIQCGFLNCGHWCNRDYSEYPPKDTPPEKITIKLDTRRRAMFCSGCHCYTVYVRSDKELESAMEEYKLK